MATRKKTSGTRRPRRVPRRSGTSEELFGNVWQGCLPSTPAGLDALEKALSWRLPSTLRELLARAACGRPRNNYFRRPRTGEELSVGCVLAVEKSASRRIPTIAEYSAALIQSVGFPPTLVPFALDTGNANPICIDKQTNDIVYWLHDEPQSRARPVADSLDALLAGLRPSPF